MTSLTAGSVYFLSPSTAGAITATEPTTEGQISKPVFVADSTTSGYFFNFRGSEVGAGSLSYIKTFVNGDLSTGVLTVTHNFGNQYCSVTVIDNNGNVVIPDEITYSSSTALTVTLTTFGAISGTWRVVVLDSGAGTSVDTVSDTAYGTGWNGVVTTAPSNNAVYDALPQTLVTAAGDILYGTAANALTKLAAGTANVNKKLFVGTSGGTIEWSSGVKFIATTKDISLDADWAITGVGFKPSWVMAIVGADPIGYASIGFSSVDGDGSWANDYMQSDANSNIVGAYLYLLKTDTGVYNLAVVKSWDADGITLDLTKGGSPTGTVAVKLLFGR
jgi:hypothetical protein